MEAATAILSTSSEHARLTILPAKILPARKYATAMTHHPVKIASWTPPTHSLPAVFVTVLASASTSRALHQATSLPCLASRAMSLPCLASRAKCRATCRATRKAWQRAQRPKPSLKRLLRLPKCPNRRRSKWRRCTRYYSLNISALCTDRRGPLGLGGDPTPRMSICPR